MLSTFPHSKHPIQYLYIETIHINVTYHDLRNLYNINNSFVTEQIVSCGVYRQNNIFLTEIISILIKLMPHLVCKKTQFPNNSNYKALCISYFLLIIQQKHLTNKPMKITPLYFQMLFHIPQIQISNERFHCKTYSLQLCFFIFSKFNLPFLQPLQWLQFQFLHPKNEMQKQTMNTPKKTLVSDVTFWQLHFSSMEKCAEERSRE